ncbi:MAG: GNAT family N-acetyltransferase [Streptosporangiales bacterium]|nr:GNAT family N-acetyltransferase [Streptosporangiales bacterium]MBO0890864.1 GNAT family N-acetyltransferase [Acidothermales bacterium]
MIEPDYPLCTERLDLRPFEPADLDAVHAIFSSPDVVRYLYEEPRDEEGARILLARKRRRRALVDSGDALSLAVVERATGAVAGDVTFMWRSEEHRQAEIGYVLDPAFHGRGYATEASAELLRFGFEEVGVHRISGRLDGRNAASARVLERLGMRREAHLVQNEWVKGEWTDELVYAILADEWRRTSDSVKTSAGPRG